MNKCPECESENITPNWIFNTDGEWIHECLDCGHIWHTEYKLKE